jgi:hypothetical protein
MYWLYRQYTYSTTNMWELILEYFGDNVTAQKILEVFYYLEQEEEN